MKIFDSNKKIVLSVTGGGSGVIEKLLSKGGASKCVLECIVPYSIESFNSFIKGKPDKYCSEVAARQLAMAAYQRAILLSNDPINSVGIGATSSLAKKDERKGREHFCYVSVQTLNYTTLFQPKLRSKENWQETRQLQEDLVSDFILDSINYVVNSNIFCDKLIHTIPTIINLENLIIGKNIICSCKKQAISPIIFPGSFNPISDGHLELCQIIYEKYKKPIDLEICIRNIEKPILDYISINERIMNFYKTININNLHFTNATKFVDKALLMPNSSFIIGSDTYNRIIEHYNPKEMELIVNSGCKFLLFIRKGHELGPTPELMKNITTIIEGYEDKYKSSSEIRNGKLQTY